MAEAPTAGTKLRPAASASVDEAEAVAAAAAAAMGGTVRLAEHQDDARRAAELFAVVWQRSDGVGPVTPELAWALAGGGNYVAIAERDGQVIGATLGFRAFDADGDHLHSHLAGVHPGLQGTGVGYALKLHQRAWALGAGLARVSWTFDPLVSRNCYFNLMKLGAQVCGFYPDYYGPLLDSMNGGDDSDRCLVIWHVAPGGASLGGRAPGSGPDVEDLRAAGVQVLVQPGPEGRPTPDGVPPAGAVALLRVPDDIVALRRSEPGTARAWRAELRGALSRAFEAGYALTHCTRDGWYVLTRN